MIGLFLQVRECRNWFTSFVLLQAQFSTTLLPLTVDGRGDEWLTAGDGPTCELRERADTRLDVLRE